MGVKRLSKISKEMIEQTYSAGLIVVNHEMSEPAAATHVCSLTGMNLNSSKMYVRCIVSLLKGEKFGRTINANAMDYYLNKILNDFGSEALLLAISVVVDHVSCQANPLLNIRSIVQKYSQLVSPKNTL